MTSEDELLPGLPPRPACRSCRVELEPGDAFCGSCGARVTMDNDRGIQISVQGSDAGEVAAVTRQLMEDAAARREAARLRSPWFSGLFYLVLLTVVVALLLAAGRLLALWALPVVIVGAALLVSVTGALQLRQDDRLSERGFLQLMGDVYRRLPLLLTRGSRRLPEGADPASDEGS